MQQMLERTQEQAAWQDGRSARLRTENEETQRADQVPTPPHQTGEAGMCKGKPPHGFRASRDAVGELQGHEGKQTEEVLQTQGDRDSTLL